MSSELISVAKWGTYAPPRSAAFLLGLVQMGFARGEFSKIIRNQWRNKYSNIVDYEARGVKYRLNISDNTTDAKILFSSKYYDGKEIEALLSFGKETFIDVGGNTGYYSLMLANKGYKQVISIEPNPPTIKRLSYNIKINNLENQIKIVPFCVGTKGSVKFYCDDNSLGSASVIHSDIKTDPILVESKPLLEILETEKINKIDGMKIDVEGIEDQVLIPFFENACKELWPKIITLEHCHSNVWENDVIGFLLDGKYEIMLKTRANSVFRKI